MSRGGVDVAQAGPWAHVVFGAVVLLMHQVAGDGVGVLVLGAPLVYVTAGHTPLPALGVLAFTVRLTRGGTAHLAVVSHHTLLAGRASTLPNWGTMTSPMVRSSASTMLLKNSWSKAPIPTATASNFAFTTSAKARQHWRWACS
jgi:hypothetical protein